MKINLFFLFLIGVLFVGCSDSGSSVASSSSSSSSSSGTLLGVTPSWFPNAPQSSLPAFHINTTDNLPIESKETYVSATFEIIQDDLTKLNGNLSIRGRGNSTWTWAKKPFRLKLEQSSELLDMSTSKHWVLLANYADKTLARNDVAFTFSRLLGFDYTVADRYVQLFLNEEYYGIYQLTEQIRISKNRLDIDELTSLDTASEVVSGGYLMELDFRMGLSCKKTDGSNVDDSEICLGGVNQEREKTFCIDSTHGMSPICIKDPDELQASEKESQKNYIVQYINDFESALYSDDFTDVDLGYRAYLDMASAVNYYIANEFLKNVEGASTSFFMYKKRDGKLYFGPVWDFDTAMGSNWYGGGQNPEGWVTRSAPWFARLFEDPMFTAQVKNKWLSLKESGVMQQLLAYPQARTQWLSAHQEENFLRWPLDGVLVNVYGVSVDWLPNYGSFEQETLKLSSWLNTRFTWMDQQFLIQ